MATGPNRNNRWSQVFAGLWSGVSAQSRANRHAPRALALSLASTAVLILPACGDGGSGADDSKYAVSAAMGHWLSDARSWALQGTVPGGGSYKLNLAIAPLAPADVPIVGGTGTRSQQTYSVDVDGATIDRSLITISKPRPCPSLQRTWQGSCDVTRSNTALPIDALAGASGAISDVVYGDCTSGVTVVSSAKNDWSLQTTSGMVMLCWKATVLDLAGIELAKQTTCIEVAPDGTLGSKASLVVTASGVPLLDARNF